MGVLLCVVQILHKKDVDIYGIRIYNKNRSTRNPYMKEESHEQR